VELAQAALFFDPRLNALRRPIVKRLARYPEDFRKLDRIQFKIRAGIMNKRSERRPNERCVVMREIAYEVA
jgi:hypothetical protein